MTHCTINLKLRIFSFIILLTCSSKGLISQTSSDSLTLELLKHFEKSDLPGFSVAVVNEERVIYKEAFGYANKADQKAFETNTIENIGSVSKTVVGLALAKAIQDGKLSLDTEINEILPFTVQNPRHTTTPILVRHLANHTSSIIDSKYYRRSYVKDEKLENKDVVNRDYVNFLKLHKDMSIEDFLFAILNRKGNWYKRKNFSRAQPGSEKEYSNLNAALAAYIVEIATETPFEEYTKTKVFEPLKMNNTYWNKMEKGSAELATLYFPNGTIVPRYRLITYPDGGLHSTTDDLSLFLQEMILAYTGNTEYLPPPYNRLLLPGDDDDDRIFWGMGSKSRNIGHAGSDPGVQADLQFNADRRIGRVILSNVNAEDNEELWKQYREIHNLIAKYEDQL